MTVASLALEIVRAAGYEFEAADQEITTFVRPSIITMRKLDGGALEVVQHSSDGEHLAAFEIHHASDVVALAAHFARDIAA